MCRTLLAMPVMLFAFAANSADQGKRVFPKDPVPALHWSSYLFWMSASIVLPVVLLLFGAVLCWRPGRRRTWGTVLVLTATIGYSAIFWMTGMPLFFFRHPNPTQAAALVDTILSLTPSDVESFEVSPYTRNEAGRFPFGHVTFDRPNDIDRICEALNQSQPNHCDYGKGSVPFFHPDPKWQSHFTIHTKTAKHACYVSRLRSDAALIDIFHNSGARFQTSVYLGTYKSEQLAMVLERLAEQKRAAE